MADSWEEIRDLHPATAHFEALFAYDHLPPDLQDVSRIFAYAAENAVRQCADGPELSAGLRKLVEAKDCCVRQRVIDRA